MYFLYEGDDVEALFEDLEKSFQLKKKKTFGTALVAAGVFS